MSEGVSVQSTPRLPLLWHVASSSPVFPHARRFSQTWPATGLDQPSTRSQPPSAHWFVGDVLEFRHLDDEGQDQGNSVGLVQSFTPGAGFMVNLLWIQDMSLKDWLLSDHGHGNPLRYDLARSNSLDLTGPADWNMAPSGHVRGPTPLAETGSGGAGTSRPPQRSRTATSCKSFRPPSRASRGNQRELLTLAKASGHYGRAADVLSQRFKAIEMALHDGEWSRASHVEILPQTRRPLLSRQEEALVARDIREEVRIKAQFDKAGVVAGRGAAGVRMGSPHDRQPTDKTKDKGRGKHGKGKDRARDRETDRKEDDKKHERKK